MNTLSLDHIQNNLKYLLTDQVKNGMRVYNIVDGTQPLKTAHVFFSSTVKNLGNTTKAKEQMADAMQQDYCEWYAKHRHEVLDYYRQSQKLDDEIIDYFLTHHDNRTNVIAKHFGVELQYVSYVIDKFLKQKEKRIGQN